MKSWMYVESRVDRETEEHRFPRENAQGYVTDKTDANVTGAEHVGRDGDVERLPVRGEEDLLSLEHLLFREK